MTQQIIREKLEAAKTIAIFGHINPDGDCVGSMLGLGALLEKQGKQVHYFTPTKPSKIYDFVAGGEKIQDVFDYGVYDLLVFVDFSDISRVRDFVVGHEEYFSTNPVISIDHHINDNVPSNWIINSDPTAMSACEVIYELTYPWWSAIYDAQIATYLYLGLTTDSGNFRYDEDHQRILENALSLVKLGADKKTIVNNSFRRKSFNGVKMMKLMFDRLTQKGGLIYSWYTEKDLEEFNLDREEADFGQIIIQDIQEAQVTAIYRTEGKTFNGSLRSKEFDVQKIAKEFGGGGHVHASGFKIAREGSFEDQVEEVSEIIAKMIKQ